MNKTPLMAASLFAVLVLITLLASACVSAPGPKAVPPPATPLISPTVTPGEGNESTVPTIPQPKIICNCPMEPFVSVTVTRTATPDDGLCHCP
ncbi:MAG: hypothetical protein WCE46_08975 [Methanoregula sp.]|uniref:hypothetical protein n=1 Tax=Methanoregula sp. TaxID=2052170 RepID=UPI003C79018C